MVCSIAKIAIHHLISAPFSLPTSAMRQLLAPRLTAAPRAQRGGTVLGLILGVLIGLFAALVVAVYVTKVPIPFAPKNSQVEGSVQAEIEKNKAWNPNAGLVGGKVDMGQTVEITQHTPVPETSTKAPAAPTPAATPIKKKTPETEANTTNPTAPSKSSDDPLADLVKRKTVVQQGDVSTDEVAAKADLFIYYVQLGAFVNKNEADSQKAQAAMSGFSADISEREQAGRQVYRVRLGPFESKEAAETAKTRLGAAGMNGALVRAQR
jgi:cell division protein FtsN